jgi:hypothetical protein
MHSWVPSKFPQKVVGSACVALSLLIGAGSSAARAADSTYTRHDYERCKKLGNDDPIIERRCEGHAGIPVVWTNEPDNSSVSFGTEGAIGGEFDVRFTFATVCNVIEWRGPAKAGRVEPVAAIVRYQLCRAIGGPCVPELVVYRLVGKRGSCIAATVNGRRTDANERAREAADGFAGSFDCERDKPRIVE